MGILQMILFLFVQAVVAVNGLSSPTGGSSPLANNNRHVCLFDSYQAVRGSHFYALLDQLFGETGYDSKHVAYVTCGGGDGQQQQHDGMEISSTLEQIKEELDLDSVHVITLASTTDTTTKTATTKNTASKAITNICDPDQVETEVRKLNPTILWIGPHENAFVLRHSMRVLNFDTIVQDWCGPADGQRACLLVGEGSGALCAGSNMAVVSLRGDDSKACPELQFRGLQVLGPGRSVSFEKPMKCTPPKTMKDEIQSLQDQISNLPLYDPQEETTVFLNPQQVYVYSQRADDSSTTSLVMNPYQRGAIEQYESASLPPAPPLSLKKMKNDGGAAGMSSSSSVARDCTGEPSEDPSRTVYTTQVEEGDYW